MSRPEFDSALLLFSFYVWQFLHDNFGQTFFPNQFVIKKDN